VLLADHPRPTRQQGSGGDRHLKFYEPRDILALVIVVGLLALSTDGALRELKARRWKSLQRLN
jgi:hypothetical protein